MNGRAVARLGTELAREWATDADFPKPTWQGTLAPDSDPTVTVACSFNGKRVAIRSGTRLTLHDLK